MSGNNQISKVDADFIKKSLTGKGLKSDEFIDIMSNLDLSRESGDDLFMEILTLRRFDSEFDSIWSILNYIENLIEARFATLASGGRNGKLDIKTAWKLASEMISEFISDNPEAIIQIGDIKRLFKIFGPTMIEDLVARPNRLCNEALEVEFDDDNEEGFIYPEAILMNAGSSHVHNYDGGNLVIPSLYRFFHTSSSSYIVSKYKNAVAIPINDNDLIVFIIPWCGYVEDLVNRKFKQQGSTYNRFLDNELWYGNLQILSTLVGTNQPHIIRDGVSPTGILKLANFFEGEKDYEFHDIPMLWRFYMPFQIPNDFGLMTGIDIDEDREEYVFQSKKRRMLRN